MVRARIAGMPSAPDPSLTMTSEERELAVKLRSFMIA
jgi:hypothetical protein